MDIIDYFNNIEHILQNTAQAYCGYGFLQEIPIIISFIRVEFSLKMARVITTENNLHDFCTYSLVKSIFKNNKEIHTYNDNNTKYLYNDKRNCYISLILYISNREEAIIKIADGTHGSEERIKFNMSRIKKNIPIFFYLGPIYDNTYNLYEYAICLTLL